MSLQTEIVRSFDRFPSLGPAWDCVRPGSGHLMETFPWHAACAQTLRAGCTLELIMVKDRGEPVGIAPLVRRDRWLGSRLEVLGAAELGEPSGFVFRDDAPLRSLCRELIALGRPALLARVELDGPLPTALAEAARGHGKVIVVRSAAAPYLDLARGWDAIWAGLSPRRRHDVRRARRLLEREGEVSVTIMRPSVATVDEALEAAFDVEARGWKGERGSALKVNPLLGSFFGDYAHRVAATGQLVVCFLRVAGAPVAMQIGVEHARAFWLLKIGHDERFAKASPGLQLLAASVRSACERGSSAYEFLGSDEPWLRIWKPRLHRRCTLGYYPYSARGAGAFAADAAGSAWRRMRRTFGTRFLLEQGPGGSRG